MSEAGYLYILLRNDFILNRQYVYKIGETTRFPPHRRLWDYPYGSIFLGLFKKSDAIKAEKEAKKKLAKANGIVNRKDIGAEYFEGPLQTIIDIIREAGGKSEEKAAGASSSAGAGASSSAAVDFKLDKHQILVANRIHYICKYDEKYFEPVYQCDWRCCDDTTQIKSEIIYESYQRARSWNLAFPDDYVIRCGVPRRK